MRLAIYHNLPSGGGKRALFEMSRRLAERHQVDVYTLSTAEHDFCDLRPFVQRHGVFPFRPLPLARRPFGRLNQGIRAADLLRLERVQRRVAAQIDASDYDVVFAHNCQYSQSPGLFKYLRTPSVYYCGEPPRLLYEPPTNRPYNRFSRAQRLGNLVDPLPGLYRRTLRRSDRENALAAGTVLVNSHYSRETFYRTYGTFACVGRLGVDTEKFRPLSLDKDHRVVSVGALVPNKGFDLVIRSLAQIDAAQRPALTIISNHTNPPEYEYLRTLAGSLGVAVDFRADVDDDALVKAYNRALLTVYAPVMEPFGFVPLESMACGTPVVGVNEAGVRETVRHEETGLLVERDPAAFARAIMRLLADRPQLAHLGEQGREYVLAQWRWDPAVRAIEEHLIQAGRNTQ